MTDHINQSDGSRIEIDNSDNHSIKLVLIPLYDGYQSIEIEREHIPALITMLQNELKNTNDDIHSK